MSDYFKILPVCALAFLGAWHWRRCAPGNEAANMARFWRRRPWRLRAVDLTIPLYVDLPSWAGGDRVGARLRAAACRQHQNLGPSRLFQWPWPSFASRTTMWRNGAILTIVTRSLPVSARWRRNRYGDARGLQFTPLPDGDVYAPRWVFLQWFRPPLLRFTAPGWRIATAWWVGRDMMCKAAAARKVTWSSDTPRGTLTATCAGAGLEGSGIALSVARAQSGDGFYAKNEKTVAHQVDSVAADVPAAERTNLEIIRTDTPTFARLVESRRNRHEEFFKVPAAKSTCAITHRGTRRNSLSLTSGRLDADAQRGGSRCALRSRNRLAPRPAIAWRG